MIEGFAEHAKPRHQQRAVHPVHLPDRTHLAPKHRRNIREAMKQQVLLDDLMVVVKIRRGKKERKPQQAKGEKAQVDEGEPVFF